MIPQDIQKEVDKSAGNQGMYFKVLLGLIVLTLLTLGQPFVISADIAGTMTIQLIIAFLKTCLIVGYYMHLKYENIVTISLVSFAVAILVIMFGLTYMDYFYIYGLDWFAGA